MILIFGGAFQGKADFAKKTFALEEGDIFYCPGATIAAGETGASKAAGATGASDTAGATGSEEAAGAAVGSFGLDFSAPAIHGLEKAFLSMVRAGVEPRDFLAAHADELRDKILMINDISQGVVPVDPVLRAWREAAGRAALMLAAEADEVYRVFCGLAERLK